MEKIAELILTSNQTYISFSSIPQGFTHLFFLGLVKTQAIDSGSSSLFMTTTPSATIAGHYFSRIGSADIGGGAIESRLNNLGFVPTSKSDYHGSTTYGAINGTIFNYSSTTINKDVLGELGYASLYYADYGARSMSQFSGKIATGAPITGISFYTDSAFVAGSGLTLYGLKNS